MMIEMLKAFFLIFIAEMGDKTQILAMAFATRFQLKGTSWCFYWSSFKSWFRCNCGKIYF